MTNAFYLLDIGFSVTDVIINVILVSLLIVVLVAVLLGLASIIYKFIKGKTRK